MGVSGKKFDLPQMKEYFEQQIPYVRVLSDMTLSEADFKSLGAKLKSAFSFANNKDSIDEIVICYLVYWVYALIYWDEETGIHDELTDYCMKLPQYQLRHHLQMLLEAFADYGIYEFGYHEGDDSDVCTMIIARHAGIPDDEKYEVFELIDDYRNHSVSVDDMIRDIYVHMPYKSRYILSLLDERSRQEVIWEIRTIMAEVSSGVYTREELIERYPRTSIRMIDYCIYWHDNHALVQQAGKTV